MSASRSTKRGIAKQSQEQNGNGAPEIPTNIEELFKAQQNKRAKECEEGIQKLLETFRCEQVPIIIQPDGGAVPVDQILRLPCGVGVVAK